MRKRTRPSIVRALVNDLSILGSLVMGVGVTYLLVSSPRERFDGVGTYLLFVAIASYGIGASFSGLEKIFRLFRTGKSVVGKVTRKQKRYWGMARCTHFTVSYTVGNKRFETSIYTSWGRFSRECSQDDEVTVLYDGKRPKSSIIKEVFD